MFVFVVAAVVVVDVFVSSDRGVAGVDVVVMDVFVSSSRGAAGVGIGRSTRDSESSAGSERRAHLTAGTGTVEGGWVTWKSLLGDLFATATTPEPKS